MTLAAPCAILTWQHRQHSCLHSTGGRQVMTSVLACPTASCSLITQPQHIFRQVTSSAVPCIALCGIGPAPTGRTWRLPRSRARRQASTSAVPCITLTQSTQHAAICTARLGSLPILACATQCLAAIGTTLQALRGGWQSSTQCIKTHAEHMTSWRCWQVCCMVASGLK